jgi:uncharacterized BrkB/YihY/UPF0761 family membrane protein
MGFSLMFKWIPHTSVPWKAAFFGSTLAALPLFLLWLYLFWSVILLSASSVAQFTLYQTHQKQKTSA